MLWLIESCQKGYLLTSVTNKQKQGGKVKKKTNKQTNKQEKREKNIKVQGSVSLIINQKVILKFTMCTCPNLMGMVLSS